MNLFLRKVKSNGDSAQGFTADRVLVHADTSVHPDLLNSRFGYVSISRTSDEVKLFTNDVSRLAPQLASDVSKSSAIESAKLQLAPKGSECLELLMER